MIPEVYSTAYAVFGPSSWYSTKPPPWAAAAKSFLDDLGAAFVLDVEQVFAFRFTIVPVNERFSGLEEDDEEGRAGFPVALRFQLFPELRAFVHVCDRLDTRLRAEDECLEAFGVRHLGSGYFALRGFTVAERGYWLAGCQAYP